MSGHLLVLVIRFSICSLRVCKVWQRGGMGGTPTGEGQPKELTSADFDHHQDPENFARIIPFCMEPTSHYCLRFLRSSLNLLLPRVFVRHAPPSTQGGRTINQHPGNTHYHTTRRKANLHPEQSEPSSPATGLDQGWRRPSQGQSKYQIPVQKTCMIIYNNK